jgi:hypothetical protein
MARRVIAGILGCAAGVLPLVLVNVLVNGAGIFGDLETMAAQNAVLLGAAALLGGILLGGTLAGWIAGRRGGAVAGGVAGIIAGVLYAITVILLVVGGARQGWGPPIAALHPIRTSAAIILVAGLLTAVALGVGALAGRGQAPSGPQRAAVSGPGGAHDAPRPPEEAVRPGGRGYASSPSRPAAGAPARSGPRRSGPRERW